MPLAPASVMVKRLVAELGELVRIWPEFGLVERLCGRGAGERALVPSVTCGLREAGEGKEGGGTGFSIILLPRSKDCGIPVDSCMDYQLFCFRG